MSYILEYPGLLVARFEEKMGSPRALFSDIGKSVTEWLHVYSLKVDVLPTSISHQVTSQKGTDSYIS
jgi:hypothetical protein